MKKTFIILGIVIVVILIAGGVYFFLEKPSATTINNEVGSLPPVTSSTLPSAPSYSTSTVNPVLASSSLPDYLGAASEVFPTAPTSTMLEIGTSKGIVTMNNFYLSNPPVDDDEDLVIKITENYLIDYDPTDSSFWIGINGPFATWQSIAEQDFLATLGISQADACKLKVTDGVIYSPNNPDDGKSFPLSFCGTPASTQ